VISYVMFFEPSVGLSDVGGSMIQMLGVKITLRNVGNPNSKPISASVRPNIPPHIG
jgi:hypothetical protein